MPAAGKKIRDLIMTLLTSTSQNVQFWAIVGARVKGQRPELGRLCLLLPWGPRLGAPVQHNAAPAQPNVVFMQQNMALVLFTFALALFTFALEPQAGSPCAA